MKHWKRISILFLFAFMLLFPTGIKAQERFDITDYEVYIKVHEDGLLEIDEQYEMYFYSSAHGFYRNIPVRYEMDWGDQGRKTYYFPVSDVKVYGDPYEVDKESEGVQIKIGDPDRYVNGNKTYHLSYKMQMRDLMIDQDYFYFNLIGGFDCTIEKIHFTIEMPKSFNEDALKFYGETDTIYSKSGNTISGTILNPLSNYDNLTIYLPLGKNYFEFQPIADYSWAIYMLSGVLLLVSFILYLKFGKRTAPVVTVEFEAPRGLGSAGVGYVIDGVVNNEDVISLIIEFANKGYLKIVDHKDSDQMKLIKVKEIDDSLTGYEKSFFLSLFTSGDEVTLKQLKDRHFGDQIQNTKEMISNHFHLKKNRVFSGASLAVQILLMIFSGFCAAGLAFAAYYQVVGMAEVAIFPFLIIWPLLSISTLIWIFIARQKHAYSTGKKIMIMILACICHLVPFFIAFVYLRNNLISYVVALVYTICMIFMIATSGKRTAVGNKWLGQILGLKKFILEAEKDRLEMLVHDDPSYFYSILPYAYVLGISDTWSKKFESINIQSPDWYVGANGDVFSTIMWMHYFNSTMHTLNSTLPSSITPPKSGSGGFSSGGGGGFSGGGFGGGGGGSW